MEYRYRPEGVCSREMIFEIENCGNKGTSCPDQLSKALEKYLKEIA